MNLEERLRERIRREGPISFYEWMKAALYDERDGYYCSGKVRQGRAGDYRTAPEISPLFAATFAHYFTLQYFGLGYPNPFTIVEVGAGSCHFAHGVLTTLRSGHPQVFNATNYIIEEISSSARERCAERLAEFSERITIRNPTVREGAVAGLTGIVFSNELIDAFPVHRVVMHNGQLRQLYVELKKDEFAWIEGDLEEPVAAYCERVVLELDDGQIFEINLDAEDYIKHAAAALDHGYLVTVDYGAERTELITSSDRPDGTLRAFRRHQFAEHVLAKPGEQDLTTTIDWTQIIEAGELAGLYTIRFERLDHFLAVSGLLDQLGEITRTVMDSAEALRLTTSARELILPTGMAASFQVLVQEKAAQN